MRSGQLLAVPVSGQASLWSEKLLWELVLGLVWDESETVLKSELSRFVLSSIWKVTNRRFLKCRSKQETCTEQRTKLNFEFQDHELVLLVHVERESVACWNDQIISKVSEANKWHKHKMQNVCDYAGRRSCRESWNRISVLCSFTLPAPTCGIINPDVGDWMISWLQRSLQGLCSYVCHRWLQTQLHWFPNLYIAIHVDLKGTHCAYKDSLKLQK